MTKINELKKKKLSQNSDYKCWDLFCKMLKVVFVSFLVFKKNFFFFDQFRVWFALFKIISLLYIIYSISYYHLLSRAKKNNDYILCNGLKAQQHTHTHHLQKMGVLSMHLTGSRTGAMESVWSTPSLTHSANTC